MDSCDSQNSKWVSTYASRDYHYVPCSWLHSNCKIKAIGLFGDLLAIVPCSIPLSLFELADAGMTSTLPHRNFDFASPPKAICQPLAHRLSSASLSLLFVVLSSQYIDLAGMFLD